MGVTSKGNVHLIGLEVIQWNNGDISEFHAYNDGRKLPVCETKIGGIGGSQFTGELRLDDTLLWSDGDVWVRDTRAPGTKTYEALGLAGLPFTQYVDPLRRYLEGVSDAPSLPSTAPEIAAHATPAENSGVRLRKLACDVGLKVGGDCSSRSATLQTVPAVADSRQQPRSATGRLLPSSCLRPAGTADGSRPKRKSSELPTDWSVESGFPAHRRQNVA